MYGSGPSGEVVIVISSGSWYIKVERTFLYFS